MAKHRNPEDDEVLDTLRALVVALQESLELSREALRRAKHIEKLRAAGKPYREIAESEHDPLIVELVTKKITMLANAGSRFRRAEARALHREGLTMEQIATLFGVSRQRISALLREGG